MNSTCLRYTINTITALSDSCSGTILCHVAYQTRQCNCRHFSWSVFQISWQYNFCCEVLQASIYAVACCLLLWTFNMQENRWHVNGELQFLAKYHFGALVRTYPSNCDENQIDKFSIKYWTFRCIDHSVLRWYPVGCRIFIIHSYSFNKKFDISQTIQQ